MKLSELNTDKALDALCELTPYISNIAEDNNVVSALDAIMPEENEEQAKEGEQAKENGFAATFRIMSGFSRMIPVLLKTHRSDVYGILSITNEKPVSEIASQPINDTIRQVREAFQDSELISFFKSSVQRVKTERSAPSAISHDSE